MVVLLPPVLLGLDGVAWTVLDEVVGVTGDLLGAGRGSGGGEDGDSEGEGEEKLKDKGGEEGDEGFCVGVTDLEEVGERFEGEGDLNEFFEGEGDLVRDRRRFEGETDLSLGSL